jgi:hypothetical protein
MKPKHVDNTQESPGQRLRPPEGKLITQTLASPFTRRCANVAMILMPLQVHSLKSIYTISIYYEVVCAWLFLSLVFDTLTKYKNMLHMVSQDGYHKSQTLAFPTACYFATFCRVRILCGIVAVL